MARVRKLTPSILKRIIAEEKQKIQKELRAKSRRRKKLKESTQNTSLGRDIKIAKVLKEEQKRAMQKLRRILKARKNIKKRITRKI
jgi:hypothetical protein